LAGWGIEDREFGLSAIDGCGERCECKERAHEVVEGIKVVNPVPPKRLDLRVRDQNTAERDQSADDKRVSESGEYSVGSICSDELPDTSVDELVHEHDEESCAGFVRIVRETNSVVPADEVENSTESEIG
jgi:hypothetical protein